ncbi:hypothetical protein A374_13560 [Fictibacillus macauensis ZFHKF-1]|uniref:Lipoprotein n=1 Tax=Fictibacillus macauensis ZFHKF-1 TaxID=1196324 RepID=I8AGB7_9BACL|nr:hypothetical protein [Fictibacillus macauensis]EIT84722.1 hypothetical protein A374_13560 [Fictibacillus macauensis ZFHKF-1]
MRNIFLIVSFLCLFLLSVACQDQAKDKNEQGEKMPTYERIKDLQEVRVSKIQKEDYKIFNKAKEIEIFKNMLKNASKEKYDSGKYDYDIKILFDKKGDERGLYMAKVKNKIVLKYIGDSTDTYIVNSNDSKDAITLIEKK